MKTILDMLNKFYSMYKEATIEYPYEEENPIEYNDMIYDDIEQEEENENLLNRFSYIYDRIIEMASEDYELFSDFICLLGIYFAFSCLKDLTEEELNKLNYPHLDEEEIEELISEENPDEEESFQDYEKIIISLLNSTPEEFVSLVNNQQGDILDDLIWEVLNEELDFLNDKEILTLGEYFNSVPYNIIESSRKNRYINQIILNFHPHMKAEEKYYNNYAKSFFNAEKLKELKVTSASSFFNVFTQARLYVKDKETLKSLISNKLEELKQNDIVTYKKIYFTMLKYYYVRNRKVANNENLQEYVAFIASEIQELLEQEELIEFYLEFDYGKYEEDAKYLSPSEIELLNNLSNVDNPKTYGSEGIWVSYNFAEFCQLKPTLMRYTNHWIKFFNSELYKKYTFDIYYSIDKEGNYTLPRLCIISSNNNIKEVLSRNNIDTAFLELYEVLDNKLKQYNNPKQAKTDIPVMEKYYVISNKIDQNINLSPEEIELIYELKSPSNSLVLGTTPKHKIDQRLNTKKVLAQYFHCQEAEVATNYKEVTPITIVSTSTVFYKYCQTESLPNLRYIVGSVFFHNFDTLEAFPNLTIVTGDTTIDSDSTKGLENIVYVGGNIIFKNVEDMNYLNPNIYIGGSTTIIKNGEKKVYNNKPKN